MKLSQTFLLVSIAAPMAVTAQQVPAINLAQAATLNTPADSEATRSDAPTSASSIPAATRASTAHLDPVNLLSGKDAHLRPNEAKAVAMANDYINGSDGAARGEAGALVYTYGASLPSLVCAPLHVCDVQLQPGETVQAIHIGDTVRWQVTPSTSGGGSTQVTHLIVKPTDSALITDMIVTTDRRMYQMKLISRKADWMPIVRFSYPEDSQAQWAAYKAAQDKHQHDTVLPSGESVSALDFSYDITGDSVKWRPLRVYTNAAKTYIQFPAMVMHEDLPTLVALGSDSNETLVNYRVVGDRFEVDKLLRHAALIRGVGSDQERIEISYKGKQ